MLQIKGEDFLKKVQLQQEKEELERKLTELDESRGSINSINLSSNPNNTYRNSDDYNDDSFDTNMSRNSMNNQFEDEPQEFDNIMLENPSINNSSEDNKKKYLILGILLVVLFLLTIIIIRLLTSDSKTEDQFTSNNSSPEMKALAENSSAIDANYQKIVDTQKERLEATQKQNLTPLSSQTEQKTTDQEPKENTTPPLSTIPSINETYQAEDKSSISNETMDETIKKVEEKKTSTTKTEQKKSVKDLVEKTSTSTGENGYFVQIGAFSKKPAQSYLDKITKEGFKYKVIQEDVRGTMFNKVLIGPYSSNATASSSISTIKEKLNLKSAFIVKH